MRYLLNSWYVAAADDELSTTPLARTLLDQKIVLFRDSHHAVHALSSVCPHRFANLSKGVLVDDAIQCPYHGLRFDIHGKCVFNPHGGGAIPARASLRVYPAVERHGFCWIWMGDPERADPDSIPDFAVLTDPSRESVHGYLTINANYSLIIDNLMDLTHIEFLHPMLSAPEWVTKRTSQVSQREGYVFCTNHAKDLAIFPINLMLKPDAVQRGDQWLDLRWSAPSNVFIDVRYVTPQEEILHPIGHFLTPETPSRTHYFFRCARNQRVGDAELSAQIKNSLEYAFAVEDEPMIVDQQQTIGDADLLDREPVILRSDNAAIQVRRLLAQMIANERQPNQEPASNKPNG